MCVQYKPEEYSILKKGDRRSKKNRENTTLKQQVVKENKKLILSEKIKMALVIVGLFSNE